jgi:lipopolysaccharide transport system ATP-binding protein
MSKIAVHVEKLGKLYRIGSTQTRYKTLRDHVMQAFISPMHRVARFWQGHPGVPRDKTIWALKDVSFDVQQGEVVGIIGHNGAGKSTLLKILTRITEPTQGSADIRGRVGSLLEVGTGFHPELTGRENVYLYGAVLGMKKAEIDRKFDEIVAFAETEEFLDTPVKHYSSGMQVRLAFAVAAHLEPEVLIVDEVLAVGDARFQRKCLNKMQDVGQHGRTVLFVSHNINAITRLCERAILLESGQVVDDGPSQQVASGYLASDFGLNATQEWPDPVTAPGGEVARLRAVCVRTEEGGVTDSVDIQQPVTIEMACEVIKPGYVLLPSFGLWNAEGICLFASVDVDPDWRGRPRPVGCYVSAVRIPGNLFSAGMVSINASCHTLAPFTLQFNARRTVTFLVMESPARDTARGDYTGRMPGVLRPLLPWSTRYSRSIHDAGVLS